MSRYRHHAGSDEGLSGDEIDVLVYESGPDADHDALMQAVERILAARAAAPDALRERVEALAEEWESWRRVRTSPRIDAFGDAAEQLRAALADPTDGAGT